MTPKRLITFLASAILTIAFPATADDYVAEVYIPGHAFHGIHGLTFDAQDRLFVGSVIGQSIYRVDTATGASTVWEGPPNGMADDLEFAPDGTLVWTSFIVGKIHARKGAGPVREIASGLPGVNSLAFNPDGRLFASQVFLADALYEIDLNGEQPPRKIIENIGGLNGFDFGPDGFLYGPLWFKGQVAKINVDTGELTVVADSLKVPAAVNFNSKGELYVLDSGTGDILKVDTATGRKTRVAHLRTAMDNLAFDSKDGLYVTVMAENSIFKVDTGTGSVAPVKAGALGIPTDLAVHDGVLYIADTFTVRAIDLHSRAIRSLVRFPEDDLEYCNGIDVTGRYVHTAGWFGSVVQTFDRHTGDLLRSYHDLPTAYDVLERPDGSLLVLQMFPGSITRITGEAEQDRKVIVRGLNTPVAMARAGADAVYVTQYAKGEIARADLATGTLTPVASGLDHPEGLALAPDGRILVAETGTGSVLAIDPATGQKTILAEGLPLGLALAPGMPPMGLTSGLAVSASGTIFISSDLEDAIYTVKNLQN